MDENKEKKVDEVNANDFNDRAALFLKEYGELVTKHGVDLAVYPTYQPDGSGGFRTIVQNTPVDIKNQPRKSPFIAQ